MNDDFLKSRLRRVIRRYQWLGLWRKLALCWGGAALLAMVLVAIQRSTGWSSPLTLPAIFATAFAVALGLALDHFRAKPDYRWIARRVEERYPELNGVLLTAIQTSLTPGAEIGYLQHRVLQDATAQSQRQDWRQIVPGGRLLGVQALHLVALFCFGYALVSLHLPPRAPGASNEAVFVSADGVQVSPGDTSIERGESLVVLARFGALLPATVNVVLREDGVAARNIPLVKSLGDPVFGGSVREVSKNFTYQLEYRGLRTREFKVDVYEHPRLVRSDVDLKFPGYTQLAPKHIEDTRRVSAVEGTRLDFALQLNKPVKSARLVARDAKKTVIPLTVSPERAVATLPAFIPAKSQMYDLQLEDADGRSNKIASLFTIDVQANRPPELKLVSPRGDVRPSALEEIAFEGTVWDDFGAATYGLAYSIAGAETKFVELGQRVASKEKKAFTYTLDLEQLGAKPDDLVSWYVWAEDVGPDGQPRRTSGDLFFGEVRPFDEIFRENQGMPGEGESKSGEKGNQTRKLTEFQKQIINATWKLQRNGATPSYPSDAMVLQESQQQALAQAAEAMGEARSPQQQALWKAATDEMEKALEKLKEAAKNPGPLVQALPAEQAAYQALLKLQARETNVTRQRNRSKGGGGGGEKQGNQRQIDELDLKQSDNRYETQRQAKAPQNTERREQLQVMNRLQELARRQQDLNERLKEMQAALQEAKTEQEREDIKRRLKRLQEDQQQMLADVDEVRQRMDKAENQSSMSQERQQLDQTREDIQKAAEAAAEGSVAQALASGTRAQRQLQQLRDELRKENSSQFAEELREMRQSVRELSQEQEKLGQKMESLGTQQRKSLTETGDRKEVIDDLEAQKERMNKLVDRATQISEQAENTEPLLSRQLYDSVRKLSQDDANAVKQARQELLNNRTFNPDLLNRLQRNMEREGGGKALEATSDLLRENLLPQANRTAQSARSEIEELKRGVERAAESVLGDDAEQLKIAQSELDALTDQLQREIAQAGAAGAAGEPNSGQQPGQQPGQNGGQPRGQPLDQRQAGASPSSQPGQQPGAGPGEEKDQPGQPGTGKGQEKGGRGQRPGQVANADQPPGRGQPGGQQPGEAQPGQGQGQSPGDPSGQPGQPGGQPRGEGRMAGNESSSGQPSGASPSAAGERGGQRQSARGGNRGGRPSLDNLLNGGRDITGGGGSGYEGGAFWADGPLLGNNFAPWTERLRDVEHLIETPELRAAVATALEQARRLRHDVKQDHKKPDWAVVQLKILKPLVEVRNRLAEELARRDSKDSLTPIDRDPVPNRFAESVRRYYEELGKDQ